MEQKYRINSILSVRPICMDDTDLIVSWRANPRVKNNFLYRGEITATEHTEWMNTKVFTGEVIQFIILENEKPIGSVYFRDINHEKRSAEYGIFIGEDDATGSGYGNLVAKWALSYAKEEMKLDVVYLRVLADNEAALKSYINAGFKEVECTKDYFPDRDLIYMKAVL